MNQQQPDPARPKPRRATTRSKTPPSNGSQPPEKAPAQPDPDDRKGWKTYWEERQQPWRTEPEIDGTRQHELAACYAVPPDSEKGIYPFRSKKLSRADVEWMLTTYGGGFTPEKGLDVRGADLSEEDLSGLPLSGLRGGLTADEWFSASDASSKIAAVQMHNTCLIGTQLKGANLAEAQLKGANLRNAQLEGANLMGAQLEGTNLLWAQLRGVSLARTQLKGANLFEAQLEGANLVSAQLEGANLFGAQLEGANLMLAQLESTNLKEAQLKSVKLIQSTFADRQGIGPQLADVRWDGTNLTVIDWSQVKILGDEYIAHQEKRQNNKEKHRRLYEHQEAVRANRQLAVALQSQGLNEEAARFAYRANVLQREVLWFQVIQPNVSLRQRGRKLSAWVFSHLLNLIAGYGYRPERSLLAYLLVIFGFMGLYLLTSHFTTPHLRWDEALVLSVSSFHGRGFFTQTISLGDAYARLTVTEAVLGLFIEISFIATFTQRFFGK